MKVYAVKRGHKTGIFYNWAECQSATNGYSGPEFKSFSTKEEAEAVDIIRKATNSLKPDEAVEKILDLFAKTRNNREFVEMVKKILFF